MGFLARLAGVFRTKSDAVNPDAWFREWALGGLESSSGIVVSQATALRDVVTMACVSIRAADLAKLPVHVMRRTKNGGKEIVTDHPLEMLLKKPNSWQTRFEFIETMQAAYLLKGNAYAPTPRNGRGQQIAMIPVNPTNAGLWESGGDLYYHVTRQDQFMRAQLAMFGDLIAADDVLHVRGLSTDGLMGISRIGMGRDAIGLSLALERFCSSLFARGARPGGVYKTKGKLGDVAFKRLQMQQDERHAGGDNHGKSMLLEEGLDWVKQTMTAVESQTVEARRLQIEQVATLFDVPLHRLGIMPEGGGDAILQSHQMYLNNTLSTDAERWESKLSNQFELDGDEIFVEFDLDRFNRADIQTRLTALGTAITRTVYTPNEARRKEGLPDDPKGNFLFQPANMVPLGTPPAAAGAPKPAGPGSDTTGSPAPGGDGDPAAVPDPSHD